MDECQDGGELTSFERGLILRSHFIIKGIDADMILLDIQGRNTEPHQARYQEGQASLCPQLLSSQRLPLELWGVPSGTSTLRIPLFLH